MIRNIAVVYDNIYQMRDKADNIHRNHKGNTEWFSRILFLKSGDDLLTKYHFVSRYSKGSALVGVKLDGIIELPKLAKKKDVLDMGMVCRRLKEWK